MDFEFKKQGDEYIPKVIIGDIRKVAERLPDNFIDCIITSPPYWQQRDYNIDGQIGQESTWEEYVKNVVDIFEKLKSKIKITGTIFLNVGYKFEDKEMLLIPEAIAFEMRKKGFVLRNKIIWYKPNFIPTPAKDRLANAYEPILLFVKEEGKKVYYLNIDAIREKAKTLEDFLDSLTSVAPKDFVGLKVVDSVRIRTKREGVVIGVKYTDKGDIRQILVKWSDNQEEWMDALVLENGYLEVKFKCPICDKSITTDDIELSFSNFKKLICPYCREELCKDEKTFPTPLFPPESEEKTKELISKNVAVKKYITIRTKNSKFLKTEEIFFASPAGRLILEGEYFLIKRKYKTPQPLISEYLNFWKTKRRVTIKEIDRFFGYKDTAGHWLRKDFGHWGKGGSLPRPDDWMKLKELLGFDDTYDELMTNVIATFQTVKVNEKGRNPGDVWEIKLEPYKGLHFAPFPRELVRRCLLIGCPKDGVVLDPFAGSGTVGEVAKKLGRKAILVDIVSDYVGLIKERCGEIELL